MPYYFLSHYAILIQIDMYEDETLICKCEQENCGFLFEQLGEVE